MQARAQAFFLDTHAPLGGQRFCVYYPAHPPSGQLGQSTPKGLVVYVHPFAEEMNKSRRMAALQARALAAAGFDVLQIDLHGCGDSAGDLGDASWQGWVDDVLAAVQWLTARHANNALPLWLWGLRAGCLLTVAVQAQMSTPCHILWWQAPSNGKLLLQQFMRLKVASDMLGGQAKGVMDQMRELLARGESVEIAGYALAPALASGLEQAQLIPASQGAAPHRVEWFELSTREDASLGPASLKSIAHWQEAGHQVTSHLIHGPAFWQTTEIETAPALVSATTAALVGAPL